MTNKNKKRRKPTGTAPARGPSSTPASRPDGNADRRARKERARQARAAERKRTERSARFRRLAIFGVTGVIGIGAFYWLNKADSPKPVSEAAVAAADAAGCTTVRSPAGGAPGGEHVAEGIPITYAQSPATSGEHYGGQVLPSSPDSYDQPIASEPASVHFMEHAGVMLYYRTDGDGAVSPDVVSALEGVAAENRMTVTAPYEGLPDGTGVALAAWDQLQSCPGTITAAQATTIAGGFTQAFACSTNAPEPNAADDC
ncbi:MAG: DUF3105 domain-containing protein [Actinomycetota bacterium]